MLKFYVFILILLYDVRFTDAGVGNGAKNNYIKQTCNIYRDECGKNAYCGKAINFNNKNICLCHGGYRGDPYVACEKCWKNEDCPQDKACMNHECQNPCDENKIICGKNAECQTYNHKRECICLPGYSGDALTGCRDDFLRDPCSPSPCSLNEICRVGFGQPKCDCSDKFPHRNTNGCYECLYDSHCSKDKACRNNECVDPCVGACGIFTICKVIHNKAQCTCHQDHYGDPYSGCYSLDHINIRSKPCGKNKNCRQKEVCHLNGVQPFCSCIYDLRDEDGNCNWCLQDKDCKHNETCIGNQCKDPCPGVCGENAECKVSDHTVQCICPRGYTGDPIEKCILLKINNSTVKIISSIKELDMNKSYDVNIQCKKTVHNMKGTIKLIEVCVGTGEQTIICESNLTSCSIRFIKEKSGPSVKYLCLLNYSNGEVFYSHEINLGGTAPEGTSCRPNIEVISHKNNSHLSSQWPEITTIAVDPITNDVTESNYVNDSLTERPGVGVKTKESEVSSTPVPVWLIGLLSAIGIVIVVVIIIYIVKIYKKKKKQNEHTYSYPSIEQLSHYAARDLVTANKKLGEQNFIPSLPPRPQQESDYDYADLPCHRDRM